MSEARFAVTAVGVDRPGIVAAVTGALAQLECNLEDTAMAILGGHFSMMLLVAAPAAVARGDVDATLAPVAAALGLSVAVREIVPGPHPTDEGDLWTINVHGADHPGIVHGVTTAVASAGANIVDLNTRVIDGDGGTVYVMVIDVTLPSGADGDAFRRHLGSAGHSLGVVINAHDARADIL